MPTCITETLLIKYFLAWLFLALSEIHQVWNFTSTSEFHWRSDLQSIAEQRTWVWGRMIISLMDGLGGKHLSVRKGKEKVPNWGGKKRIKPERRNVNVKQILEQIQKWIQKEIQLGNGVTVVWKSQTEEGKVPNGWRQSPKLRSTQPERNPTGANMKEIQLGNAVAVTVERKSQTKEDIVPNWGRQKSSSTAATNALLEVLSWPGASLRVEDTNSVHFDPPFNEFFCQNLPLKKNSPLSGGSFSQLTTKWVGEPD